MRSRPLCLQFAYSRMSRPWGCSRWFCNMTWACSSWSAVAPSGSWARIWCLAGGLLTLCRSHKCGGAACLLRRCHWQRKFRGRTPRLQIGLVRIWTRHKIPQSLQHSTYIIVTGLQCIHLRYYELLVKYFVVHELVLYCVHCFLQPLIYFTFFSDDSLHLFHCLPLVF